MVRLKEIDPAKNWLGWAAHYVVEFGPKTTNSELTVYAVANLRTRRMFLLDEGVKFHRDVFQVIDDSLAQLGCDLRCRELQWERIEAFKLLDT